MKVNLFEAIIKILPRWKLEEFMDPSARSHLMDRKTLQSRVIALDSPVLRDEIADYVTKELTAGRNVTVLPHQEPVPRLGDDQA